MKCVLPQQIYQDKNAPKVGAEGCQDIFVCFEAYAFHN